MPIVEGFFGLHPVLQALLASLFTWGVTALGAASVFLTRTVGRAAGGDAGLCGRRDGGGQLLVAAGPGD
jgi:hypothetical protein